MPEINFLALVVAAIVPNALGAAYYGPIVGKHWMASLGMTEEDFKGRNEAVIYGTAFLLSLIVAFFLKFIIEAIHKDVNATGELVFASFGTFAHGALHGGMLAATLVVPVIISLGLFQKTKGSNILINSIFWILCYTIMGGILDVWR